MDEESLNRPEDDFTSFDAAVSSTSPYQSTTEPVAHRRSFIAGLIIEMRFIKSLPGMFKILEFLFGIAAAVSIGASNIHSGPYTFMQLVSISAIIFTSILYAVSAFGLHTKTDIINWPLTDLVHSVLFCILYAISSSILATVAADGAQKSATAFGFMSAILFIASAWFAYKFFIVEYRRKHPTVSHIKGIADKTETEEFS